MCAPCFCSPALDFPLTPLALQSEPAMLSMNANGEGTLAPAGTTLANAARNSNRAPKRQQAAASASALLRGIRKNSAAGGPAVQSRSPDNRVLKHADSRQFYAKQKAIQQHHAHHRLEAHTDQQPWAYFCSMLSPHAMCFSVNLARHHFCFYRDSLSDVFHDDQATNYKTRPCFLYVASQAE